MYNKYFLAKKILKHKGVLGKSVNNNDLSIHVLSGHNDLTMLIWSLASFYRVGDILGELYIHSDGSLTEKDIKTLNKFLPGVKIIKSHDFLERHGKELEKYPVIKKFRTEYPQFFLLKKLIDPYFVSNKKYHLIIDSDLFWFREPREIKEELRNECRNSLMMVNNVLCNVVLKNNQKLDNTLGEYNSGIVLYGKENFNLDKLTDYLNKIDANNRQNEHFIEQTGYAICLENLRKLPVEYYVIKKELDANTIVKHYTSPRRPLFFIEGIKYEQKFL